MFATRFFCCAASSALLLSSLISVAPAAEKLVTVKLTREDDEVTVVANKEQVTVQIDSKTGIGKAEIQPVGKEWPDKLVVELNLKALEGHSVTQGDIRWAHGGDTFRHAKGEWVRVAELGKDSQPKLINKDGKFYIELPGAWLKVGAAPLKVEWIDFYRR